MSVSENNAPTISATFSGDAGISCTLTFTDNGDSASLSPSGTQTCDLVVSTEVGPTPVKLTFTDGGTAKRAGSSLKADGMAITVQDGQGGTLGIQGTGTLAADCTSK